MPEDREAESTLSSHADQVALPSKLLFRREFDVGVRPISLSGFQLGTTQGAQPRVAF
jgi:hypothetical protein